MNKKIKLERPAIWNELDEFNPREVYKVTLLDMFRLWDALNPLIKESCRQGGLPRISKGKYKNMRCLTYKGLPVILK